MRSGLTGWLCTWRYKLVVAVVDAVMEVIAVVGVVVVVVVVLYCGWASPALLVDSCQAVREGAVVLYCRWTDPAPLVDSYQAARDHSVVLCCGETSSAITISVLDGRFPTEKCRSASPLHLLLSSCICCPLTLRRLQTIVPPSIVPS